jgi:hypothetical protein
MGFESRGACWYTLRGSFDGVAPVYAVCDARLVGGCSSVGRAPRSQRGGQRFDPAQLHHRINCLWHEDKRDDTFVSLFVS